MPESLEMQREESEIVGIFYANPILKLLSNLQKVRWILENALSNSLTVFRLVLLPDFFSHQTSPRYTLF